jgi:hypothetical protein
MSRREERKAQRRLVKRARKRLVSAGVLDRVAEVRAAVQSELFARAAAAAFARAERRGAALKDHEGIRTACMSVLAQTFPRVETRDVQLNFAWDPATKKLDVYVHPAAATAAAAMVAAAARSG